MFILFVCAKSNFMVTYFMKKKSETLMYLKKVKLEYPDMEGYQMKILQGDEDTMYTDQLLKEFCLLNYIHLQTSPPYHHASNGLAERSVQTVMDKTTILGRIQQQFTY